MRVVVNRRKKLMLQTAWRAMVVPLKRAHVTANRNSDVEKNEIILFVLLYEIERKQ